MKDGASMAPTECSRLRGILGLLAALGAVGCARSPSSHPPAHPPQTAESLPAEIVTPTGAAMVLIPAGEFLMGSSAQVDSQPPHKVSVGSFYMDKYEVTQELYEKLMGKNPSRRRDPKQPVERVRWREAIAFCNARSAAEGLKPCYDVMTGACDFAADGYRLPTEAEWEYACRGGSDREYCFGDDPQSLTRYAWFKANAGGRPHPVGQLRPNAFGLFDMHGNVGEWCNDWYRVDYYAQSPTVDPQGPPKGEKKTVRGGSFKSPFEDCTSAVRSNDYPGFDDACVASDDCGFRCVRRAVAMQADVQ
ncbi:MAG: formylglycine-generating enzyme family protein [Thermoguttaceae bacterium]